MAAVSAVVDEAKRPENICNLFARKNPKPSLHIGQGTAQSW